MIFLTATFALGFIADPIINVYLDPYNTIATRQPLYDGDDDVTWIEHFVKGFAGIGLLGFAKFLLTLSPWQWFNMRSSGMMGGGRAGTGRDRLQQISWLAVLLGAMTVLWVCMNRNHP